MAGTLKTLLAKLKRRRRSKAAASNHARGGVEDERSGKKDLAISNGIANLLISDPFGTASSPKSEPPKIVHFGTSYDFDFTFTPDSQATWPGPDYDKTSKFAPGVFDKARPVRPKVKQKSSKRKLSAEAGQLTLRSKEPQSTKTTRDLSQSRKSPRPFHYYGSPPSRDPPHNLLNLPGEIRNQIYRLICIKEDPIVAQFRPIIIPNRGKGRRAKPLHTTKRFPREPSLALVSQQVMSEALSIFYSENTFIFKCSTDDRFKDLIMTRACMMKKWTPHSGLAESLGSIEIHFNVHPSPSGTETMIYTLRKFGKTMDGNLQISSNELDVAVDSCTCFDRNFITALKKRVETEAAGWDVLKLAASVPLWRTEALIRDSRVTLHLTPIYRPRKLVCEVCGLATLRSLDAGL